MFSAEMLIVLIPTLPLVSAIVTAMLGPKLLRQYSHIPTILAIGGSFVLSLMLLGEVRQAQSEDATVPGSATSGGYEKIVTLWTWADIPNATWNQTNNGPNTDFHVDVVLRVDALTTMMLCMVTFVATLVAIFASSYMHGDRGFWRFFSYVSLFVFSMTMLVSVSNFVLLFVFWEAVGVCSYLLIGFWYQKPEAAAAGKKAFLVNRVGDFGFALALFLIWTTYGSLDFHDSTVGTNVATVNSAKLTMVSHGSNDQTSDVSAKPDSGSHTSGDGASDTKRIGVLGKQRIHANDYRHGGVAFAICVLLLLGACGKSAQFPLHVWLPDAMEGPTPVSALIHAATMVTAGVYMVARCTPLFMASPDAQLVVACVGTFTALLAGLIALTQWDLKRVLAYSTVSQLGLMFLSLGTGTRAGVEAGMFHLFTHAFFKALLFLGAGSVMHAMGNIIDMRRFSGLRTLMKVTYATFLIGSLALAGLPPLAGFWSKDAVIGAVHDKVHMYQHELDHRQHPAVAGNHAEASQSDSHPAEGHSAGATSDSAHASIAAGPPLTDAELARGIRVYQWLYYAAMLTAFLTAFYTFRAFLMTFHGELKVPHEAGHHAHESPPVMYVPLVALAIAAVVVGMLFDHTYNTRLAPEQRHEFAAFIAGTPQLAAGAVTATPALDTFHLSVAGGSVLVAAAGIGLAMYLYLGSRREVRALSSIFDLEGLSRLLDAQNVTSLANVRWIRAIDQGAKRAGLGIVTGFLGVVVMAVALVLSTPLLIGQYVSPYRLSQGKFFFDEIYAVLIVKPLRVLANFAYWIDRWIIDGFINLIAKVPGGVGNLLRRMQTGLVPFYALAMVIAILLLIASQM